MNPEFGEHLQVQCEPENPVDQDGVYLKTSNGATVGHLKERRSRRFAKIIFYYLRGHPEASCRVKVTDKRLALGDGKGLRVSCILQFTGERKFVSVLKEQFHLFKEK